jgi:hypothetical protein
MKIIIGNLIIAAALLLLAAAIFTTNKVSNKVSLFPLIATAFSTNFMFMLVAMFMSFQERVRRGEALATFNTIIARLDKMDFLFFRKLFFGGRVLVDFERCGCRHSREDIIMMNACSIFVPLLPVAGDPSDPTATLTYMISLEEATLILAACSKPNPFFSFHTSTIIGRFGLEYWTAFQCRMEAMLRELALIGTHVANGSIEYDIIAPYVALHAPLYDQHGPRIASVQHRTLCVHARMFEAELIAISFALRQESSHTLRVQHARKWVLEQKKV